MHTAHSQHGKTFGGIMIGLVLAVAIIALLMWYMNTHKTTFQPYEPRPPLPAQTEVLRPQDQGSTPPPQTAASAPRPAPQDDLGQLIDQLDKPAASDAQTVTPIIARKTPPAKQDSTDAATIPNEAPVKPAKPAGKSKTLQIGSFSQRTQAESQQAKLLMLDIKTRIETATIGGQTVYRVRTGALNADQANAAQQRLSENHIDSIMLPN